MGEANRRKWDTLDGGPPSDDKIALQVEIFDPRQASDDRLRRVTMAEPVKWAFQRPTPVCVACTYEFGFGERPTALFHTRPMFPKSKAFTLISGAICPQCAARPTDELMAAIIGYLRAIKSGITIVETGTA
jgi:hypothetical protein